VEKSAKIYIAGHRGMVGSAILRKLESEGFHNIITRTSSELDLRNQADVRAFFETERPDYVFLAAAKVGGIMANNIYRAEFLNDNLLIQNNVIDSAYRTDAKKTDVPRIELYLSEAGPPAFAGRFAADRPSRTDQRALRDCENCRY
jgi:GDP-L-fucose synthase